LLFVQQEYPGTSNVLLLTEGMYDEWFKASQLVLL
jgi:hypothetical protein